MGMPSGKKSSNPQNNLERDKRSLRDYARYSNLGFRLVAVILAAFFIGRKLDQWIPGDFPLLTLIFSVAGLTAMLYLLIKDVSK